MANGNFGGFDLKGNFYQDRFEALEVSSQQMDEAIKASDNTMRSRRSHSGDWNENFNNIHERCVRDACPHFVQWNIGVGPDLYSCQLVGESYTIDTIPKQCMSRDGWRLPTIHEMNRLYNKKWLMKEYATTPEHYGYGIWTSTEDGYYKDSYWSCNINKFNKDNHRDITKNCGHNGFVVLVKVENNKLLISKMSNSVMNYDEALEYSKGYHLINKSVRLSKD